jgi:hypothetical protein
MGSGHGSLAIFSSTVVEGFQCQRGRNSNENTQNAVSEILHSFQTFIFMRTVKQSIVVHKESEIYCSVLNRLKRAC